MDWQNLAWIGIFVVFLFLMMRGCGGMRGGCGMGSRRSKQTDEPRASVPPQGGPGAGNAA